MSVAEEKRIAIIFDKNLGPFDFKLSIILQYLGIKAKQAEADSISK